MSMKCSSSGIVSSSGSSKRPIRACSKGILGVERGGQNWTAQNMLAQAILQEPSSYLEPLII